MPESDEISDQTTSVTNTTNVSQSGTQRIATIFILVASLGLLICVGLLIQTYFTHTPTFELPEYSPFKSAKTELFGSYSFLIYMSGGLTLLISLMLALLNEVRSRKIGYILVLIGSVLIFCSYGLSYTSDKLAKEWWSYFSGMSFAIGLIILILSELVDRESKHLRKIIKTIYRILFLTTFVLSILNGAY